MLIRPWSAIDTTHPTLKGSHRSPGNRRPFQGRGVRWVNLIRWRRPPVADLPPAIHERLSLCKRNTPPSKDSFPCLKEDPFFPAQGFVAALSSVYRPWAGLFVRPAIHSGWRRTYNLTASTRPMISSGTGGPCPKRSEVGYPTTTKPRSGWPVPGQQCGDVSLRRGSRRRDDAPFFDDPGRCGGSS